MSGSNQKTTVALTAEAASYQAALVKNPSDPALLVAAARVAIQLNQRENALSLLRRAHAITAKPAELSLQAAILMLQVGLFGEAEAEGRRAAALEPALALAQNVLGSALRRQGKLAEAEAALSEAARLAPRDFTPLLNLGNLFMDRGDPERALAAYRRALQIAPADVGSIGGVGRALLMSRDYVGAVAAFEQALTIAPRDVSAMTGAASALFSLKRFAEAGAMLDRALALSPNEALRVSKAKVERALGRREEAIALYRSVLAGNPGMFDALLGLGVLCYYDKGDDAQALAYLEQALAIVPTDAIAAGHLISCLAVTRQGDENANVARAAEVARRVLGQKLPAISALNIRELLMRIVDFDALDRLGDRNELRRLFIAEGLDGGAHGDLAAVETLADRYALIDLHREWGRLAEVVASRSPISRPSRGAPREKIRVGVLSADLRDHPVSYFALPIFELYDRSRFELFGYSPYPKPADAVQRRIAERCTQFRVVADGSDADVAQTIAQDDLDILFDLGGATQYNRLAVMAYRPAPVQVSWLGYPHSAGLSTIDYILVDPFLKPDDPRLLIEKPFQMSHSWVCFGALGFPPIPIDPELPEVRRGRLTFGTMNNPNKFTRAQIGLWAKVLLETPGSVFLFVRPEASLPIFRENLAKEFQKHGVAPERLEFIRNERGRHLELYNLIDIGLDAGPQTGGTTTCESMWMGCPVVTTVGPAFFERLSYSNLSNGGLGDLCARDADGFVATATALARDRDRRLRLRRTLRADVSASPLGRRQDWVDDWQRQILSAIA